jgi:hypothetical protein
MIRTRKFDQLDHSVGFSMLSAFLKSGMSSYICALAATNTEYTIDAINFRVFSNYECTWKQLTQVIFLLEVSV